MRICQRWIGLAAVAFHLWGVAALGQTSLTLFGTNAAAGRLNLCEQRTNGTNCLVLKAADGQGGTRTVTIPDVAGNWTVAGQEVSNVFTGANTFTGATVFSNNTWAVKDGSSVTRMLASSTNAALVGYDSSSNEMWRLEHQAGTKGRMFITNSGGGYVGLTIGSTHSSANAYIVRWPLDLPTNGYFLQTDGSGNLSWASGGSSGVTTVHGTLAASGSLGDTTLLTVGGSDTAYLIERQCSPKVTGSGSFLLNLKWTDANEGTTHTWTTAPVCYSNTGADAFHVLSIRAKASTAIYYSINSGAGTGTIGYTVTARAAQ